MSRCKPPWPLQKLERPRTGATSVELWFNLCEFRPSSPEDCGRETVDGCPVLFRGQSTAPAFTSWEMAGPALLCDSVSRLVNASYLFSTLTNKAPALKCLQLEYLLLIQSHLKSWVSYFKELSHTLQTGTQHMALSVCEELKDGATEVQQRPCARPWFHPRSKRERENSE